MLSKALKTNADISKGILTGCLRATKEGIFTGLNNLGIDTVLTRRGSLSTAIGFTPEEVMAMFDYYGLGNGTMATASGDRTFSARGMSRATWKRSAMMLIPIHWSLSPTGTTQATPLSSESICRI